MLLDWDIFDRINIIDYRNLVRDAGNVTKLINYSFERNQYGSAWSHQAPENTEYCRRGVL